MRRLAALAVPVLAVLAACSGEQQPPAQTSTQSSAQPPSTAPAPPPPVAAPPLPQPVTDGRCPYLATAVVEQANAQRVSRVRLSADKPHPACFFLRGDGTTQLSVRVFVGEPPVAKAVVDQAAPIATSNPEETPAGWKGGSQTTNGGAVYAVAKGGTAVVVSTNQGQTIKARRIVEQIVSTLRL
ncbi:uncharacterized protein DUF2020 [Herbihabitans rhizosphaerae]|uniref:Uncharacterized protein DUF2020 n=1 Tax=Herbihabitans rhizosphaerae TaxID=1872711 RepID=A0A4Q7KLZ9_9PSEU|nr:DUF2020 domain-containing protein [Herbihabitans rhizosphaerae]RZS37555.1 uncharacterized protein DUF2020 [Herbihabitans rhizosphaerae]